MDLATVDKLLTTTRSVRKRLDLSRPVEPSIIKECLEIAIQAPTGNNQQSWRFVVITDAAKRARIAAYYKQAFDESVAALTQDLVSDDPLRLGQRSVIYLSEHLQHVPVFIIPCIEGRPDDPSPNAQAGLYGSILPATWSLMLALRSRGLGSALTTVHLRYEREVAALLGIPPRFSQVALLPVAYYTGKDFKAAKRRPASEVSYWNSWDTPG